MLFSPTDLQLPSGVHLAWTGRDGGISEPPYDSLNLGDHVGDDPAHVAENRRRVRTALGARPVFLKQVHGWDVAELDDATLDGLQADACFTTQPGVACTVMVADCLPVLLWDRAGRVVAAAHAGWRGLAGEGGQGVVEHLWSRVWPSVGASADQAAASARAWLGPCIGPSAFEVGPEVRDAFVEGDAQAAQCFRAGAGGKWFADLPALARRRLQRLGITDIGGNDGTSSWCTVTQASRFFSHRRDRVSGRFAAFIWLG